jgi:hypothetical protein
LFERRLSRGGFGNDHHKKSGWNLRDEGLENFPKAAAHFVSSYGTPNAARGDNANLRRDISARAQETDAN